MSQPRDTAFNASSPHSSTGNADSYKNEGTPDTRLTAFSPEEGSARSSKYYSSLTLTASDPQPLRFPGKPVSTFRPSLAQADKDPFTSSQPSVKREQRLSPLASDFQPFSLTVGGRVQPSDLNLPRNDGPFDASRSLYSSPASLINGAGIEFTRYVVLASSGNKIVTPADANALLSVSLHDPPGIFLHTNCVSAPGEPLRALQRQAIHPQQRQQGVCAVHKPPRCLRGVCQRTPWWPRLACRLCSPGFLAGEYYWVPCVCLPTNIIASSSTLVQTKTWLQKVRSHSLWTSAGGVRSMLQRWSCTCTVYWPQRQISTAS